MRFTKIRSRDDGVCFCAIEFDHGWFKTASTRVENGTDSYEAGRRVLESLPMENLRHVLVFSEGLDVNGSQLVDGLESRLPGHVSITGGTRW